MPELSLDSFKCSFLTDHDDKISWEIFNIAEPLHECNETHWIEIQNNNHDFMQKTSTTVKSLI